jgi:hypothetical protein
MKLTTGVNLINILRLPFAPKIKLLKLEKAVQSTFVWKTRLYNVDKIYPRLTSHQTIRGQFYQHFTCSFYTCRHSKYISVVTNGNVRYKKLYLFLVKDVAKISTNKLSTFDFFHFYFTTCFNPKQGPLQVILHFELFCFISA